MQHNVIKIMQRSSVRFSLNRLTRDTVVTLPTFTQRHAGTASVPLPHGPDPQGLKEYSVVYTDRALNHMSSKFQQVMNDISRMMKETYKCESVAIVPGSGTYGMEAVARQFGSGQKCLVIRNGFFSFRWSQIFQIGSIPSEEIVLMAQPIDSGANPAYAPHPVSEVVEKIRKERPGVVFAPHVETSAGMILPDAYLKAVADAVHEVGGIFVLDCIASGCVWVDMAALGVDVLISAPQKGWSGPPCAGLVMMSKKARTLMETQSSTSFAMNLKTWTTLMETYEKGGHMYYCTMPTDALTDFRDVMLENMGVGTETLKAKQIELGEAMRALLTKRGLKSVAADGFGAPGVVVAYTADDGIKSGAKFVKQGMQIAGGVPLMVDDFTQSAEFKTFRLGLFGLDKLQDVERTVRFFEEAIDAIEAA